MKKLSIILVLTLLLSVTTPVLAVEGVKELRGELKTKKVEVKKEIEDKRAEIKDKNLENKKNKAQATMKRLRQGITQRYENVLKQKTNIEARITKIEAMVVPTPKTARDLTAAKAELAKFSDIKYKSDLALFDAKVTEVLASTTPLKLTPELKTMAKTLDTDIKALRTTLANTLRLIIKNR